MLANYISDFDVREYLLPQLTARERLLLELRYFHRLTYQDIGRKLRLSRTRVQQLLEKAIHRARRCWRNAADEQVPRHLVRKWLGCDVPPTMAERRRVEPRGTAKYLPSEGKARRESGRRVYVGNHVVETSGSGI